jgi:hypothetical protein
MADAAGRVGEVLVPRAVSLNTRARRSSDRPRSRRRGGRVMVVCSWKIGLVASMFVAVGCTHASRATQTEADIKRTAHNGMAAAKSLPGWLPTLPACWLRMFPLGRSSTSSRGKPITRSHRLTQLVGRRSIRRAAKPSASVSHFATAIALCRIRLRRFGARCPDGATWS